jgi:hypothetical protein
MTLSNERRTSARQCIEPHEALGFLKREAYSATVRLVDKSRSGFTVSIPPNQASQFPGGENAILQVEDVSYQVMVSGYYREGSTKSHLGLKLLAEKYQDSSTQAAEATKSTQPATNQPQGSRERFTFGLYIALLIAVVALPGIGDLLGTAPWIRQHIINAYSMVTEVKS